MMPQVPCALLCSFLILAMAGCRGAGAVGEPTGPKDGAHPATGSPEKLVSSLEDDGPPPSSLEEHQMRKRFIWTLTQEPYFYGKYDGGEGSPISHGSELLPEPLPLRKPSSMHKRLYPRWYQAYVYKPSTFSPRSVGERKRFQPFHPMARFRGLSMGGGGSTASRGYHSSFDLPLSDQPGHPVPSAPNAQPSPKFNPSAKIVREELEEEAEEDEDAVRAGELLQYLRSIASDRGLSGNTKSFRFGISRRK